MSLPVEDTLFQSDDSGPVSWLLGLGRIFNSLRHKTNPPYFLVCSVTQARSSSDHIIILAVTCWSWKEMDN